MDTALKAQVIFKIQIQEWENTLLRGHDAEAFAKYRDVFIKSGKEAQEELSRLQLIFDKLGLDKSVVSDAKSAQIVEKLVKGMGREPT